MIYLDGELDDFDVFVAVARKSVRNESTSMLTMSTPEWARLLADALDDKHGSLDKPIAKKHFDFDTLGPCRSCTCTHIIAHDRSLEPEPLRRAYLDLIDRDHAFLFTDPPRWVN